MEYVSTNGIKLRNVFLHNGNWWKLFVCRPQLISINIITNVLKLLVCRTAFLGFHFFICPRCTKSIKVPHSCKSRFCPSCGKKATDNWIKNSFNSFPHTTWQHITFTMPSQLWEFFWTNRYLMNLIPKISANIILTLSNQKKFLPGIFLAVHTFGRDLKKNIHIHLSTTIGGLSLSRDSWLTGAYFFHDNLKKMWRYQVIDLLRIEFKKGRLKMPLHLKHIKSYETFSSWLSQFYSTDWVIHLGKYLKRPPIGETRLKAYDGNTVTYEFLDHYSNTKQLLSLPVLDFLDRLISHIPDKNFRSIRYYGFLSNRLSGKLLPVVHNLLKMPKSSSKKVFTPWRKMIKDAFHFDPLKCPLCKTTMILVSIIYPSRSSLISMHKEIAHGAFPLLI